jgi:hypothetical protein
MANQSPPIGPANQWALAATAILTVTTRRVPRYDCLGGGLPGPDEEKIAKTILANSWGIESREKLESMLEWLGSTGHTAEYQKAAAAFPQSPPQQQQADPKLAFVGQYGAQIGPRGLLAWDLGRLLAVAGWGFLANYCNPFEAWGVLLPAADRIRNAYSSWDEYGEHYRLGALFAMPAAAAQIEQVLAQLRAAPDSPWRSVPWKVGDANVGAPPYGGGAPGAAAPSPAYAGAAPPLGGAYGAPPSPGAASYGAPPPIAVPGSPPQGAPGAAPYGGAPMAPTGAPYGGAPMAPTGAPYGGAPMAPTGAPYGGAPMAPTGAPYGGAPMGGGPKKSKTMLIVGAAAGGLVMLGIVFGIVWHFTHEHEEHEQRHEQHEEKKHH